MENKNKNSFVEGSVFQALIKFAVPVLGALILQAAYGAVDLLVVGRFGNATSITAVGTGSTFMQMLTYVIISLAMGTTVTIGRHIGEQNAKKAGDTVGTSIMIFLVFGIGLTILLEVFAGNIVALLQVPEASVAKTITYIRICGGGILVIIAYNVISSILRGIGNANLPLLFVGIACVVNVIGDLFLIGVLRMDVAGAAIATVAAQFVSVVSSLLVLRKQKLPFLFSLEQCKVFRSQLRQILSVGIPIALQEGTVQISFLVINSLANDMGPMPAAGYAVAQKIVTFIVLVPSSVMQSVSAFVAQNMGAGKKDRAIKGFFVAMITGCSVGVIIFIIGFFGGALLSSLFTTEVEVIAQSADYLRGYAIECIITCILFASIGYFNGCGKSIPVMLQGITSAVCVRIPVSIFMSKLPNASLMPVGFATPITTVYGILFFAICFILFRNREKKKE